MDAVIRLDHVTKSFGSQTALHQVSLEVPPGVVCALLGENGAGKTTAIRIMLGLSEPDAGSCHVLGMYSKEHGEEIRRAVGYVSERPTMYEWMTVGEIGWFAAGFYPPGFFARYQGLIAQFGLPADRKINALSKGTRAKVALSLAMAHEPRLLILDEPTSGLDTLVRREFLESMVDLAADGRTVLLSSHQISEVERVADVVAILHEGRLVLVERLEELKRQVQELTITLAEGIGAPPDVGGEILRRAGKLRQWQVLIRGPVNGQVDRLRSNPMVRQVEVRTPALEEIFVAYLASSGKAQGGEQ
jgi:ABC-2 type transport system ATP-binding protein